MAIHPVAWSDWASTPMTPTRVAGLCYVRSDSRAFMPKAKRWGGHHDHRGYEQRERGHLCVHGHLSDWEDGFLDNLMVRRKC
jgi:hypothetical protein